ncbi:zinc-dependent peptidase [Cryomorphaceae bacterium 1068]|nr:zinc-dependent peptidase [Cryomorphaceae bacterium 1068]
MSVLVAVVFGSFFVWLLFRSKEVKSGLDVPEVFPLEWRTYLLTEVNFYAALSKTDKAVFEKDVLNFLKRVRITGVQTTVDDQDRLLVASSAVIPVFAFPEWEYSTLHEVLLYPDLFDASFNLDSKKRSISGMVGSGGVMNRVVIFSKPALHNGFDNITDKHNVGIHEFVHLFDKEDGQIDGIPKVYMDNQALLPWVKLIHENMAEMLRGNSDINPYGATNSQEFLAVTSEYFFQRPRLLKEKHPELYEVLSKIFNTDLAETLDGDMPLRTIGRNDKCPCGSGKKFKDCCMLHS